MRSQAHPVQRKCDAFPCNSAINSSYLSVPSAPCIVRSAVPSASRDVRVCVIEIRWSL